MSHAKFSLIGKGSEPPLVCAWNMHVMLFTGEIRVVLWTGDAGISCMRKAGLYNELNVLLSAQSGFAHLIYHECNALMQQQKRGVVMPWRFLALGKRRLAFHEPVAYWQGCYGCIHLPQGLALAIPTSEVSVHDTDNDSQPVCTDNIYRVSHFMDLPLWGFGSN